MKLAYIVLVVIFAIIASPFIVGWCVIDALIERYR